MVKTEYRCSFVISWLKIADIPFNYKNLEFFQCIECKEFSCLECSLFTSNSDMQIFTDTEIGKSNKNLQQISYCNICKYIFMLAKYWEKVPKDIISHVFLIYIY